VGGPDRPRGLIGRLLHDSFLFGLILKAALGLSQLAAALAIRVAASTKFTDQVIRFYSVELTEDPDDRVARFLLDTAKGLSVQTETFYALYFLGHGVLNLGVAALLAARIRWAYPVSIAVLLVFVAYQLYRFALTFSATMILLSAFDLVIVALIWREYALIRRGGPDPA
jgi:uncharacterized membrane protein